MILIAEAGATNISWVGINNGEVFRFKSPGYNPLMSDSNLLRQMLITSFPENFDPRDVQKIHYYGTGCASSYGTERVNKALAHFFSEVKEIVIDTDLVAAARAVLGKDAGVIGILGTGANAGYYNGAKMETTAPSLGFLLGDEGSGAYLGKLLVADVLRGRFSDDLVSSFWEFTKLSQENVVATIMNSNQPNKLLASFVPFIKTNKKNEAIKDMLDVAFEEYFHNYIKAVVPPSGNYKVCMVGGIAYHFQDFLIPVFNSQGIANVEVFENAIEPLIVRQLNK